MMGRFCGLCHHSPVVHYCSCCYFIHSASVNPEPKVKDGGHSQAEDQSSGDEKKKGFKDFLKQLPRRNTVRTSAKDGKGSLEKDSKPRPPNIKELTEVSKLSEASKCQLMCKQNAAKKSALWVSPMWDCHTELQYTFGALQ